ncbi:beta strand repeat-containing protein, partial [Tatumella terrea]|uniref:beta strand repeat-containing protein n=1 Tax=Tatumella terrea TaxID=419007 RepID=UPI0031DF2E02
VTDGQATSSATLSFSPINTPPVAADDTATAQENTPVSGNVLTNDTDKDGDSLTVTQFTVDGQTVAAGQTATLSGVGTLTIGSKGDYTFTPVTGYTGAVPSATYIVTDGQATSSATLSFSPINTPPVANDDSAVAKENTAVSGNVLSNDTDKDGDTLTVTQFTVNGQTVAAGQTATISGVGTLTIGSKGDYTFTPVSGYTGAVPSATYIVTDGQATSSATLSFSPINTPPVANDDSAVAKENTAVSGNVLSNDTDKDGDTLTVTQFTVNGQTVAAGQTATLSGVGTLTIGSKGDYTFTPVSGYTGAVPSASYTITDGQATSSATLSFSPINTPPLANDDSAVAKENTAVSGNVLTNDTDKDGDTLTVTQFTVNGQTVAAGQTATISGVGTLTIGSKGDYTFTPVTGYTGAVPSATYIVTDGQATSSATLSFSPINTPPVANDDSAVAKENTAVSGNVLSNDTDKDGDTLTVTQFTVNGQTVAAGQTATISGVGTLTIGSKGDYTFTPVSGYTGAVPSASYTITDGQATSSATLSFSAINTPPVATDDIAYPEKNTAVSGNVLSNDTDKDGDTLTVTQFTVDGQVVSAGQTATLSGVGTLTIGSKGDYTFTPVSGYTGAVPAATYTITDGQATATAVLHFTDIATGSNTSPVAEDDHAVTKADTAVSGNVLDNDTDKDGDTLTVTGFSVDGHTLKAGETATLSGVGTLTISSNGTYTFTPVTGYTGPVPSATYTITDGQATSSAILSFSAINTPPVAIADHAVTDGDTPVSGNVLSNDTDKDGDTLTVTQFTVDGQTVKAGETATISGVGSLKIGSDGAYTFTPVAGYTGAVPTATYTITDGQATASATLSFSATRTPPVAADDVAHPEKNSVVTGNVLTNDTDKNGDSLTVTQFTVNNQTLTAGESATISGVGVLTINANGSYTFSPEIGYAGPVPTATYTITNGQGTASATLSFTDIIDNAPDAVDDHATVQKNTTLSGNALGNDSDKDGDALMITDFTVNNQTFKAGETATISGVGTLTFSAGGQYIFTPVKGYVGPVPAATYTVSDGQLTSQATVYFSDIKNTAPTAVNDHATTVENTPVSGNVLSNDTDKDGDSLTVTQFTVAGQTVTAGQTATISGVGTLTIGSDGAYTFTPVSGYTGPVPSATYTITDGQATSSAILSFSTINTPPVANNDSAVAKENTAVSGNVLSNDTDKDGDSLTVTQFTVDGQTVTAGQTVTISGVGTLTISSDGTYTFTPLTGYTGAVPSATYTITDGQATSSATLSFSSINSPPVAENDTATPEKNSTTTGNVLTNDSDKDHDTLTVTNFTVDGQTATAGQTATISGVGTLTIGSDGAYSFTPVTGYTGPVPSATYTITDGQATASATLSFSNIVNTPPSPQDDTISVQENTPATGNVLSNDSDKDGDTLTVTQFTIDGQTLKAGETATLDGVGTLTIGSDGAYTFTPATGYTGAVPSATYTVTDGQAEATATLTIQDITQTHTNTPPVANDDSAVAKENTAVSGNVLSNDTDTDGDTLTVTQFTVDGQTLAAGQTATLSGVGTLTIGSDGTYTFTPVTGYTGAVPSASYTITDGQATASATLSFSAINTPPVANNDTATAKENTAVSGNVLSNDTDKDGDTLTVTGFTVDGQTLTAGETATLSGVGTLTISSDGAYTFTPVTGYTGPVPSATYTITDGQAIASAVLSFTAINTPPVAVNDYVTVDKDSPVSGNVLSNDTDKDGDTLSVTQFSVDGQTLKAGETATLSGVGTLTISSDGAYTFTPVSGYVGAIPAATYTISDGQSTAEASVIFDHAPVIEITQSTEVTYTPGTDISGFNSSSWQNNWTSAGWKGVWPSYDSTNHLVNLSADGGSYTGTMNATTTFNTNDVLDLTVGWNNGWSGTDDGSSAVLSFSYGTQTLFSITTPGKSTTGTTPGTEYADAEKYAYITLSEGIEVSLDGGKTWLDGSTAIPFETWRLYQKDQTVTDSDLSHILVKGMQTGVSDHLVLNWDAPGSPADDFQISGVSVSQVTETTSDSDSHTLTYDPSTSSGTDSTSSQLAVLPNISVSDSDGDDTIQSATITLSGKSGDQLWINGMDATTHTAGKASYSLTSDGDGTLTLTLKAGTSGSLSSSDWNSLLEGLRFGTTGDSGTRQLTVTVNDGQLDSNTETVDINVTGAASSGDLPGYSADTQTTTTDALLSTYSLENVSDLASASDTSSTTETLPALQSLLSTGSTTTSSTGTSASSTTGSSSSATDSLHTTSETSSALLAKEDELSSNNNTV